jgi:hypothetical protein
VLEPAPETAFCCAAAIVGISAAASTAARTEAVRAARDATPVTPRWLEYVTPHITRMVPDRNKLCHDRSRNVRVGECWQSAAERLAAA